MEKDTPAAIIRQAGIKITCDYADSNPNAPEWNDAAHYRCVLRRGRRQMTLYFSQGYGISGEPTVAGVLECLLSDAAGVESARCFEDWCADYGFDTDSRRAERTYRLTVRQTASLKRLLGPYWGALYNAEW